MAQNAKAFDALAGNAQGRRNQAFLQLAANAEAFQALGSNAQAFAALANNAQAFRSKARPRGDQRPVVAAIGQQQPGVRGDGRPIRRRSWRWPIIRAALSAFANNAQAFGALASNANFRALASNAAFGALAQQRGVQPRMQQERWGRRREGMGIPRGGSCRRCKGGIWRRVGV